MPHHHDLTGRRRRRWGLPALALGLLGLAGCAEDGTLFTSSTDQPQVAGAADAAVAAAAAGGGATPVAAQPDTPAPTVGGRSDWAGPLSAAALDMRVTARDERGWRILWQLVGDPPPGPLPEDAMAVAVFVGSRPTGGHLVDIRSVDPAPDGVVVRWVERLPAPGEAQTQQVTAPYAIELVPRRSGLVRYDGERLAPPPAGS